MGPLSLTITTAMPDSTQSATLASVNLSPPTTSTMTGVLTSMWMKNVVFKWILHVMHIQFLLENEIK